MWRKGRLFPHEWTPAHIGPFSHIGSLLIVLPVLLAVRQRRQTHGCNLYHHYHHRIIVIIFFSQAFFELSETRGFYKHDIIRRRRSLDRNISLKTLQNLKRFPSLSCTRMWSSESERYLQSFGELLKLENFMNCKFWETHIRFYKLQSTLISLHSAK